MPEVVSEHFHVYFHETDAVISNRERFNNGERVVFLVEGIFHDYDDSKKLITVRARDGVFIQVDGEFKPSSKKPLSRYIGERVMFWGDWNPVTRLFTISKTTIYIDAPEKSRKYQIQKKMEENFPKS